VTVVVEGVNITGLPNLLYGNALGFSQATNKMAAPAIKKIKFVIDRIKMMLV
jgi:hypothetical protein